MAKKSKSEFIGINALIKFKIYRYNSQTLLTFVLFLSDKLKIPEAAIHRCSYEKVFRKYAANLQENTHAEVGFQ